MEVSDPWTKFITLDVLDLIATCLFAHDVHGAIHESFGQSDHIISRKTGDRYFLGIRERAKSIFRANGAEHW